LLKRKVGLWGIMKILIRRNAAQRGQSPPPKFHRRSNRTLILRSLTTAGLGVAAKITGLINQIVSVALISSALGAEGLQEQMLAISFVGWFYLTLCGMQTSLPVLLIRSRSDMEAFAAIAKAAFLLATIGSLCALGLVLLVLRLGWIGGLASAPIATAAICNAAVIVFSLSERIFQATDRIAQFNILNMTGTLISLAAAFFLVRTHGTAGDFVVAFYLGMLFPFLVAAFAVIPQLRVAVPLSLRELSKRARQLIGVGIFGFGYEIAAYCKFQAPLALLGVLGLSKEIAPVGLGLRLVVLLGGGLSIVIPILFLRIGTAIHVRDQDAGRLWTRLGIACAAAVAAAAAGMFIVFGDVIYRAWTGGVVRLDHADQIALAAFSAISLGQHLLFPLAAPDPAIAGKLRWLFWLEGPAVLAAGGLGGLAVPPAYGGAGMLAGVVLVMSVVSLIMLIFIVRRTFPQGLSEGDGLDVATGSIPYIDDTPKPRRPQP
jgi:O-antigen/teichoic acid export membrane protein